MNAKVNLSSSPPAAWRILISLALARLLLHCATNWQYGFHRDELGLLDDARFLDWGYVSYPPFTSFIARIALILFGPSLVGVLLCRSRSKHRNGLHRPDAARAGRAKMGARDRGFGGGGFADVGLHGNGAAIHRARLSLVGPGGLWRDPALTHGESALVALYRFDPRPRDDDEIHHESC